MSESYSPPMKESMTRAERLGKILLKIGLTIALGSFLVDIMVSLLTGISGGRISIYAPIGLILFLVGILMIFFDNNHAEDSLWVMQMSPFAGNN